jgi:hypothetical protein
MFQENIKKIEIKNTLSTTNKKVILLMFLTNTTSAWAHQQSKLNCKQASNKQASKFKQQQLRSNIITARGYSGSQSIKSSKNV